MGDWRIREILMKQIVLCNGIRSMQSQFKVEGRRMSCMLLNLFMFPEPNLFGSL